MIFKNKCETSKDRYFFPLQTIWENSSTNTCLHSHNSFKLQTAFPSFYRKPLSLVAALSYFFIGLGCYWLKQSSLVNHIDRAVYPQLVKHALITCKQDAQTDSGLTGSPKFTSTIWKFPPASHTNASSKHKEMEGQIDAQHQRTSSPEF